MGKYISEAHELKIKEFVADWVKRIRECEESGHKQPVNLKYCVTGRSSHRDKALGYCDYCHTGFERGLTAEEDKEIDDFRKGFREDYVKTAFM